MMICFGSSLRPTKVAGDRDRAPALGERSKLGFRELAVVLILWGSDFDGVVGKLGDEAERFPSIAGASSVTAGLMSGRLPEEYFFGRVGRGSRGEMCSGLEGEVIGLVSAHWPLNELNKYALV